jgi:hypothetical protein
MTGRFWVFEMGIVYGILAGFILGAQIVVGDLNRPFVIPSILVIWGLGIFIINDRENQEADRCQQTARS